MSREHVAGRSRSESGRVTGIAHHKQCEQNVLSSPEALFIAGGILGTELHYPGVNAAAFTIQVLMYRGTIVG